MKKLFKLWLMAILGVLGFVANAQVTTFKWDDENNKPDTVYYIDDMMGTALGFPNVQFNAVIDEDEGIYFKKQGTLFQYNARVSAVLEYSTEKDGTYAEVWGADSLYARSHVAVQFWSQQIADSNDYADAEYAESAEGYPRTYKIKEGWYKLTVRLDSANKKAWDPATTLTHIFHVTTKPAIEYAITKYAGLYLDMDQMNVEGPVSNKESYGAGEDFYMYLSINAPYALPGQPTVWPMVATYKKGETPDYDDMLPTGIDMMGIAVESEDDANNEEKLLAANQVMRFAGKEDEAGDYFLAIALFEGTTMVEAMSNPVMEGSNLKFFTIDFKVDASHKVVIAGKTYNDGVVTNDTVKADNATAAQLSATVNPALSTTEGPWVVVSHKNLTENGAWICGATDTIKVSDGDKTVRYNTASWDNATYRVAFTLISAAKAVLASDSIYLVKNITEVSPVLTVNNLTGGLQPDAIAFTFIRDDADDDEITWEVENYAGHTLGTDYAYVYHIAKGGETVDSANTKVGKWVLPADAAKYADGVYSMSISVVTYDGTDFGEIVEIDNTPIAATFSFRVGAAPAPQAKPFEMCYTSMFEDEIENVGKKYFDTTGTGTPVFAFKTNLGNFGMNAGDYRVKAEILNGAPYQELYSENDTVKVPASWKLYNGEYSIEFHLVHRYNDTARDGDGKPIVEDGEQKWILTDSLCYSVAPIGLTFMVTKHAKTYKAPTGMTAQVGKDGDYETVTFKWNDNDAEQAYQIALIDKDSNSIYANVFEGANYEAATGYVWPHKARPGKYTWAIRVGEATANMENKAFIPVEGNDWIMVNGATDTITLTQRNDNLAPVNLAVKEDTVINGTHKNLFTWTNRADLTSVQIQYLDKDNKLVEYSEDFRSDIESYEQNCYAEQTSYPTMAAGAYTFRIRPVEYQYSYDTYTNVATDSGAWVSVPFKIINTPVNIAWANSSDVCPALFREDDGVKLQSALKVEGVKIDGNDTNAAIIVEVKYNNVKVDSLTDTLYQVYPSSFYMELKGVAEQQYAYMLPVGKYTMTYTLKGYNKTTKAFSDITATEERKVVATEFTYEFEVISADNIPAVTVAEPFYGRDKDNTLQNYQPAVFYGVANPTFKFNVTHADQIGDATGKYALEVRVSATSEDFFADTIKSADGMTYTLRAKWDSLIGYTGQYDAKIDLRLLEKTADGWRDVTSTKAVTRYAFRHFAEQPAFTVKNPSVNVVMSYNEYMIYSTDRNFDLKNAVVGYNENNANVRFQMIATNGNKVLDTLLNGYSYGRGLYLPGDYATGTYTVKLYLYKVSKDGVSAWGATATDTIQAQYTMVLKMPDVYSLTFADYPNYTYKLYPASERVLADSMATLSLKLKLMLNNEEVADYADYQYDVTIREFEEFDGTQEGYDNKEVTATNEWKFNASDWSRITWTPGNYYAIEFGLMDDNGMYIRSAGDYVENGIWIKAIESKTLPEPQNARISGMEFSDNDNYVDFAWDNDEVQVQIVVYDSITGEVACGNETMPYLLGENGAKQWTPYPDQWGKTYRWKIRSVEYDFVEVDGKWAYVVDTTKACAWIEKGYFKLESQGSTPVEDVVLFELYSSNLQPISYDVINPSMLSGDANPYFYYVLKEGYELGEGKNGLMVAVNAAYAKEAEPYAVDTVIREGESQGVIYLPEPLVAGNYEIMIALVDADGDYVEVDGAVSGYRIYYTSNGIDYSQIPQPESLSVKNYDYLVAAQSTNPYYAIVDTISDLRVELEMEMAEGDQLDWSNYKFEVIAVDMDRYRRGKQATDLQRELAQLSAPGYVQQGLLDQEDVDAFIAQNTGIQYYEVVEADSIWHPDLTAGFAWRESARYQVVIRLIKKGVTYDELHDAQLGLNTSLNPRDVYYVGVQTVLFFKITNPAAVAPVLPDAAVSNDTVLFSWAAEANHAYQIEVKDANADTVVVNGVVSVLNEYLNDEGRCGMRLIFANGEYTWRMRGVRMSDTSNAIVGVTDWVEGNPFIIGEEPVEDPVAVAPTNLARTVDGQNVTFTWTAAEGAAYQIMVMKGNEQIAFEPAENGTHTLSDLEAGNYTWKMRGVAFSADVNNRAMVDSTAWVDGPAFEIEKVANMAEKLANVNIYPNPTSGQFTVNVPVKANVEIFGTNGTVVERRANVDGKVVFNLNHSGIYFVRIATADQAVVKRVIVR